MTYRTYLFLTSEIRTLFTWHDSISFQFCWECFRNYSVQVFVEIFTRMSGGTFSKFLDVAQSVGIPPLAITRSNWSSSFVLIIQKIHFDIQLVGLLLCEHYTKDKIWFQRLWCVSKLCIKIFDSYSLPPRLCFTVCPF